MRELHPSTVSVLRFFDYDHLPPELQVVSEPFHRLAHLMVAVEVGGEGLDGPELTVGLRKLLEAKDCMVRAAVAA